MTTPPPSEALEDEPADWADDKPFEPEKYLAQAKWLLEWHNKRSDALSSRAVTVLGFNGAILALLVNAARLEGLPDLHVLKWVIAAAVVRSRPDQASRQASPRKWPLTCGFAKS